MWLRPTSHAGEMSGQKGNTGSGTFLPKLKGEKTMHRFVQ